jgi:hypothetical protein
MGHVMAVVDASSSTFPLGDILNIGEMTSPALK